MEKKREVEGCGGMQSIVNNLKSATGSPGRLNADQMKFYLRRLKVATGFSEQVLILKMLFFAFDNYAAFDDVRAAIAAEWKETR